MKNTSKTLLQNVTIFLMVFLFGCSDIGETVKGYNGGPISGTIIKGVVVGANVQVFQADGKTRIATDAVTDSEGNFRFSRTAAYRGPIVVRALNGFYTNEQNIRIRFGEQLTGEGLSALYIRDDIPASSDINLNPVTSIVAGLVLSDGDNLTEENIARKTSIAFDALGLDSLLTRTDLNLSVIASADLEQQSAIDLQEYQNKVAVISAAITQYAYNKSVDIASAIEFIYNDISDNSLLDDRRAFTQALVDLVNNDQSAVYDSAGNNKLVGNNDSNNSKAVEQLMQDIETTTYPTTLVDLKVTDDQLKFILPFTTAEIVGDSLSFTVYDGLGTANSVVGEVREIAGNVYVVASVNRLGKPLTGIEVTYKDQVGGTVLIDKDTVTARMIAVAKFAFAAESNSPTFSDTDFDRTDYYRDIALEDVFALYDTGTSPIAGYTNETAYQDAVAEANRTELDTVEEIRTMTELVPLPNNIGTSTYPFNTVENLNGLGGIFDANEARLTAYVESYNRHAEDANRKPVLARHLQSIIIFINSIFNARSINDFDRGRAPYDSDTNFIRNLASEDLNASEFIDPSLFDRNNTQYEAAIYKSVLAGGNEVPYIDTDVDRIVKIVKLISLADANNTTEHGGAPYNTASSLKDYAGTDTLSNINGALLTYYEHQIASADPLPSIRSEVQAYIDVINYAESNGSSTSGSVPDTDSYIAWNLDDFTQTKIVRNGNRNTLLNEILANMEAFEVTHQALSDRLDTIESIFDAAEGDTLVNDMAGPTGKLTRLLELTNVPESGTPEWAYFIRLMQAQNSNLGLVDTLPELQRLVNIATTRIRLTLDSSSDSGYLNDDNLTNVQVVTINADLSALYLPGNPQQTFRIRINDVPAGREQRRSISTSDNEVSFAGVGLSVDGLVAETRNRVSMEIDGIYIEDAPFEFIVTTDQKRPRVFDINASNGVNISQGLTADNLNNNPAGTNITLQLYIDEPILVGGQYTIRMGGVRTPITGIATATDSNARLTNYIEANYTVEDGDQTFDLNVTSVVSDDNNGTDRAGNSFQDINETTTITVEESDNSYIVVDASNPTIVSISDKNNASKNAAGDILTIEVEFNEEVYFETSGTRLEPIENRNIFLTFGINTIAADGTTGSIDQNATYSRGNNTQTLEFTYTIPAAAGEFVYLVDTNLSNFKFIGSQAANHALVDVVGNVLEEWDRNDTFRDGLLGGAIGNIDVNFTDTLIDNQPPTLLEINSSTSDNNRRVYYREGQVIEIEATFSEVLRADTRLELSLNAGGIGTSTDINITTPTGQSSDVLTGSYTVKNGDNVAELNVSHVQPLVNGVQARDIAGNEFNTSGGTNVEIPAGKNLSDSEDITLDTTIPHIVTITGEAGIHGLALDLNVTFSETLEDSNITFRPTTNNSYLEVEIDRSDRTKSTVRLGFAEFSDDDQTIRFSGTYTQPISSNGRTIDFNDADGVEVLSIVLGGNERLADLAGNDANLTIQDIDLTDTNLSDVQVVTAQLEIFEIDVNVTDGNYTTGEIIEFNVTMNKNINRGSEMNLTLIDLNTSGGPDPVIVVRALEVSRVLTGTYTVADGDNVLDLDVTARDGDTRTKTDGIAQNDNSDNPLTDPNNNNLLSIVNGLGANRNVAIDTQHPYIRSITSTERTYEAREPLEISIIFNEQVFLDNAGDASNVRLTVEIGDDNNVTFSYKEGHGSNTLVYERSINSPELDTSGIEVKEFVLDNNATLRDVVQQDFNRSLDFTDEILTDGNLSKVFVDARSPGIESISSGSADATYITGDQIDLNVTMDEVVKGGSKLTLNLVTNTDSPVTVTEVNVTTTADGQYLTGTYTVQLGDRSADLNVTGVRVANSPNLEDLHNNSIAAGTNLASQIAGISLADNKNLVVDTNGALIDEIRVMAGLYGQSDTLEVNITFDDEINVTYSTITDMNITLKVGDSNLTMDYFQRSISNRTLQFRHTFGQSPEYLDTDGIEFVSLNVTSNNTLIDSVGNPANVSITGLAASRYDLSGATVDARNLIIERVDANVSNGFYSTGDEINITLHFNKPLVRNGRISLQVDANLSNDIIFTTINPANGDPTGMWGVYTVADRDNSGDLAVEGSSITNIDLNDTTGVSYDAFSTYQQIRSNLNDTRDIIIDSGEPRITSITAPPGNYAAGEKFNLTVKFDRNVTLTGDINVTFEVDNNITKTVTEVTTPKLSGNGTSTGAYTNVSELTFQWQIPSIPRVQDTNGTTIKSLNLTTGSTLQSLSRVDANLTIRDVDSTDAELRLARIDTQPPEIVSIEAGTTVDGNYSRYTDSNGTEISVVVNMSEAIAPGSVLRLWAPIQDSDATQRAQFLVLAPSTLVSNQLTGSYRITALDDVADFNVTGATNVDTNDTAGNAFVNDSNLSDNNISSLADTSNIAINHDRPTIVEINSSQKVGNNNFYTQGEKIEINVTFSEAIVNLGGSLSVEFNIDNNGIYSRPRANCDQSVLHNDNTTISCEYTVPFNVETNGIDINEVVADGAAFSNSFNNELNTSLLNTTENTSLTKIDSIHPVFIEIESSTLDNSYGHNASINVKIVADSILRNGGKARVTFREHMVTEANVTVTGNINRYAEGTLRPNEATEEDTYRLDVAYFVIDTSNNITDLAGNFLVEENLSSFTRTSTYTQETNFSMDNAAQAGKNLSDNLRDIKVFTGELNVEEANITEAGNKAMIIFREKLASGINIDPNDLRKIFRVANRDRRGNPAPDVDDNIDINVTAIDYGERNITLTLGRTAIGRPSAVPDFNGTGGVGREENITLYITAQDDITPTPAGGYSVSQLFRDDVGNILNDTNTLNFVQFINNSTKAELTCADCILDADSCPF